MRAALFPSISCAYFQVLLPGGLGSVLALVEEQQESPSCVLEGVEVTLGLFTVRASGSISSNYDGTYVVLCFLELHKKPVRCSSWCRRLVTAFCSFSSVQVHTVRGTGVLQQYVDKQQLPKEMDGDFHHCHSDWLAFRLVRV